MRCMLQSRGVFGLVGDLKVLWLGDAYNNLQRVYDIVRGWIILLDILLFLGVLPRSLSSFGVLLEVPILDDNLNCILEVDALFNNMSVALVELIILGLVHGRLVRCLFRKTYSTMEEL